MKNLTHSEMPEGIVRRLSQLHLMGLPALRAKFKELYGFDTSCSKPEVLRRRLAFRVQELHFGGLTEQEEQKLNDSISPCCLEIQCNSVSMLLNAIENIFLYIFQ